MQRDHARAERLARRARPRRDRRRSGRALRRDRAPHPRAAGARPLRPPRLHDGAARGLLPSRALCSRTPAAVVSAALCYYAPEPELPPGHGRLPRYTWHDAYAELREKLDALGRALGGAYRVLVDANQHVDREAAARSRCRLLRQEHDADHRRHGSWVVLGTLVTAAELEPTPPLAAGCGVMHALHRRLPDGRARRAGLLDATSASPTGRRCPSRSRSRTAPSSVPRSTAATSARTSVPGTAASNGGVPSATGRPGRARRPARLARRRCGLDDELLAAALRPAQRPALAAAERARRARQPRRRRPETVGAARARMPGGEDELLAEHARWALERLEQRCS